jgi:hypothetical protein
MELEYGGIKATGGKLFIIISLLGTLGGGLWGGFEFYKDYMDMKQQITDYPDSSKSFDKRLDVMATSLNSMKEVVDANMNALKDTVSTNMNAMKNTISTDMSSLKKTITTDIHSMKELVSDAQETARDIRTDIKTDINEQSDQISAIDKRSRADGLETRQAMRNAEKEVRELISDTSKRWDDKLTKVDSQIEALETKLDKKITKALANPLAAMSKTK